MTLELGPAKKAGDVSSRMFIEETWDGVREYVLFDHDGNPIGLQHVTDHTPIVEYNKARQNDGSRGYGPTREWRHIARVNPAHLIQWAIERGVTYEFINSKEGFEEIVLKYLKDPDYRNLRVDV
jgi:hypothetical protein